MSEDDGFSFRPRAGDAILLIISVPFIQKHSNKNFISTEKAENIDALLLEWPRYERSRFLLSIAGASTFSYAYTQQHKYTTLVIS
jgi:hypothetical protein